VSAAASRPLGSLTGRGRGSARTPPAWTLTAAFGLLYVILALPSSDLAAASYRSDLFARVGFTLWDNSWYAGHHLLAYSLLGPALGALIGTQVLAALSMTAATALFAVIIEGRYPRPAARLASLWFAVGAAVGLLSNRVPFDLGLAVALGAVLAALSGRLAVALALSVLTSLASPVDGAFLALAWVAWGLEGPRRGWPAALTGAALGPIALLALVFPEGGSQPFVPSAFYPALAGVLLIAWLIPAQQRLLRIGVLLYAAALTGAYVIPTAVGANADRLGALFGAPVAALMLLGRSRIGRRPRLLLAAAPLLLYWQANASVTDFAAAVSDPGVRSSYYDPLLGELRRLGVGYGARPVRVEVVPLTDHWEARWVAPHVMIARGWERQLDRYRDGLFYDEAASLAPAAYHAWLTAQSVSYVALPDVPLDYSAITEGRLLRGSAAGAGGPPAYLREVWHSAHWRLFAAADPRPLIDGGATLTQVSTDSFAFAAPRAGSYTVRLHFTSYWALASGHGCVSRAPGDWTSVRAPGAGVMRVVIKFSPGRIFDRGARCR
jgi:hypothetical protein